LQLAPSSFGLQPYKILNVASPNLREKLKPASWNQSQVTEASQFYVLCARTDIDSKLVDDYINLAAKIRGVTTESLQGHTQVMQGFITGMDIENLIIWAKKQAYIALGFLLDAAAQHGIDACPMEGFDAKAYDEILNLQAKNLTATVACAVGLRASDDAYANLKKVRVAKKDLILNL
jgi:nitroreductase / dihydropteridine reductase